MQPCLPRCSRFVRTTESAPLPQSPTPHRRDGRERGTLPRRPATGVLQFVGLKCSRRPLRVRKTRSAGCQEGVLHRECGRGGSLGSGRVGARCRRTSPLPRPDRVAASAPSRRSRGGIGRRSRVSRPRVVRAWLARGTFRRTGIAPGTVELVPPPQRTHVHILRRGRTRPAPLHGISPGGQRRHGLG